MMRQIIFIALALTLIFCSGNPEKTVKPVNYKVEIKQWGTFMNGDCWWIISLDSIVVKQTNRNVLTDNFSKVLPSKEKQRIIDALTKVELKEIQKEYVDNSAPDDLGEYDFKISIDGEEKEFHIYQVKLVSIFNLVKQINELLPEKHQIGYNDEYFRFKK